MSTSPSNSSIAQLVSHLSLSPSTTRLALAIHSTVSNYQDSSNYLPACAVYLALLTDNSHSSISLSKLLTHPPKQLRITQFFLEDQNDKLKQLQNSSSTLHHPVHEAHKAFMVMAIIWRDFTRLCYRSQLFQLDPSISIPKEEQQSYNSNFIIRTISSSQQNKHKSSSQEDQQTHFINSISNAATTCPTTRVAWLLFLVCKAHVTAASPLSNETAYHLLLASLCAGGFIATKDQHSTKNPVLQAITAICTATNSSVPEVRRLYNAIQTSLPPPIRSTLPCMPPSSDDLHLTAFARMLDTEYSSLLVTPSMRNTVDERVFIDAPHQAAARRYERKTAAVNAIPGFSSSSSSPSPSKTLRKPRSTDNLPPQTPRTRANIMKQHMPITPINTNRHLPRSNALDALAALAVASTNSDNDNIKTPKRSTQLTPGTVAIPLTPISSRMESLKWISSLADSRSETRNFDNDQVMTPNAGNTSTSVNIVPSEHLNKMIEPADTWNRLIHEIVGLSRLLVANDCPITSENAIRHALAVYFEALEGILRQEWERSPQDRERVIEHLIDNAIFHHCLLVFSWETVAGANGCPAAEMAMKAMTLFKVSPFAVSKIVEAFLMSLRSMPKQLKMHIINCDRRFVEYLAWERDSELVSTITAWREWSTSRSNGVVKTNGRDEKESEEKKSENNSKRGDSSKTTSEKNDDSKSDNMKDQSNDEGKSSNEHGATDKSKTPNPTRSSTDEQISIHETSSEVKFGSGKEFALEVFYKKLLRIASERTQKLLISLSLDAIVEPVWAAIKYSICEKWTLMVDRHLDHIILCCVYGVCRVRKLEIKFLEVLQHFRLLSHVMEPSYTFVIPDISRNVSLNPHRDLIPSSDAFTPRRQAPSKDRDDIIKFYNHVYIDMMKAFLLNIGDTSPLNGLTTPRRSSNNTDANGIPRTPMSRCSPATGELVASSTPRSGRRDMLKTVVLNSPMRMIRQSASPRRIGRVTVSPMTDRRRPTVFRPSQTNTPRGMMTPGTRCLFAFAESPIGSLKWINRTVEGEDGHTAAFRRPVPLSYDGQNAEQRTASIRRRYADVLDGRSMDRDKRPRLDPVLQEKEQSREMNENAKDIKLGASLGAQQQEKKDVSKDVAEKSESKKTDIEVTNLSGDGKHRR